MPCGAVRCHALPRCAALCGIVPCCAVRCLSYIPGIEESTRCQGMYAHSVKKKHTQLSSARLVQQCSEAPCGAMRCRALSCSALLCCVVPSCAVLCRPVLCFRFRPYQATARYMYVRTIDHKKTHSSQLSSARRSSAVHRRAVPCPSRRCGAVPCCVVPCYALCFAYIRRTMYL